ncbi:diguanylate cyclase [Thalassotalea sp. PLHSN55]|uniref:diguanylate cyclase n=1 Tax=Thalassotalea sp. PLHSN55 TaxID=3435888 RepID=UPI003F84A074
MSNQALDPVTQYLNDAIEQHRSWFGALMKSISCELEHHDDDKRSDAHKLCGFGQWYYGKQPSFIIENKAFKDIEPLHKKMHQHVAKVLANIDHQQKITPADFDQLYRYLNDFIATVELLKNQIQELQYHRDPLTGAFNRTTLIKELSQIQDMVKRKVSVACVVMVDLDWFKSFNDNYGHAFGDYVLQETTKYIHSHLRPFDKLFRYGGEEFLISLVNTDLKTAVNIAQRMCAGIAKLPIKFNGSVASITASFGVASLEENVDVQTTIQRADKALYQAKDNGRNRVEHWQP